LWHFWGILGILVINIQDNKIQESKKKEQELLKRLPEIIKKNSWNSFGIYK